MANPTYQSGFYAPGRGTAKHPELWDGCVGAWNPGLGNTGLSLLDWSGNQNNGTLTGGPTWGVSDGRQSLLFNGTTSYGDVPNSASLNVFTDVTVAFWARFNTYAAGKRIFSKRQSGTPLEVYISDGTANGRLTFYTGGTALSTSSGFLILSEWHHYAATLSGTSVSFYRDGKLTDSGTVPAITGNINNIGIGHFFAGSYLHASLGDLRFYTRAVSQPQIRLLAQRPGIAYERAPRKFYSLPAAAGNPTGILINNLQSIRLGL